MKETELMVYCARNPRTGKLVSNITNPKKRFWLRKAFCEEAIRNATSGRYARYDSLELVTFKLVEVEDERKAD